MATLLKIDSSPMGVKSISRMLTQKFAEAWLTAHPGGTVIERDLTTMNIPAVDEAWVAAAYSPNRTPEQNAALAVSDALIADLEKADEYVFGVPMHNFGVPANVKLWIDQVVRVGRTFRYGATGPMGLLQGKKATVLIASGGSYTEASGYHTFDFVKPYLELVLKFMGVEDVATVTADNVASLRTSKVDLAEFLAPATEKVLARAA